MANRTSMQEKLGHVFADQQAEALSEVIHNAHNDLVRGDDFNELKGIVRDLAKAQQRTEQRVEELAASQQRTEQRVEELAAAQQRTEQRVEELAAAQQRTEQRVEELAAAQQRTEQRVEELAAAQQRTEQRVKELAEAQQRTEQRVEELAAAQQRTEQRVEELAAAQQRTEQRVEELAAAQQRTEQRVEELAAAQQRTEQRVEELAAAQQRTEQRVEELAAALQRVEYAFQQLARQVGGLSDRMGGDLEDVAAIVIHDVLEREFGWQIDELARAWQTWDGEEEELDVFGQAHDPARPDTRLWIVGEVKFNLTMRDVERFALLVDRAARRLDGEVVPVCFGYRVRPAVREATKKAGYRLVFSNGRMM